MHDSRWLELQRTGAKLDIAEMKAGWHYCEEFDGLLTDGELLDDEGRCAFCGFDGRLVNEREPTAAPPV